MTTLTGFAGGYLLGCLVMLGLTFLFAALCAVNQYAGDMSKIYDADALDTNFETDNDNPTGDEKNGGRNDDRENPGEDADAATEGSENK